MASEMEATAGYTRLVGKDLDSRVVDFACRSSPATVVPSVS